jgi:hypothetical protein
MLRKSSIFMMLLLATGSLIGISSIYQPTNVETQPGTEGTTKLPRTTQQKSLEQAMSDTQLLDRLMPLIINRLDSKMLAQKVLPHLDLNVVLTPRKGASHEVTVSGPIAQRTVHTGANCAPDEIAVSGGWEGFSLGNIDIEQFLQSQYVKPQQPDFPYDWIMSMGFKENGHIAAIANCLSVELGFKDVKPFNLLDLRQKGSK